MCWIQEGDVCIQKWPYFQLHALWYLRVWSQRASTQILGQVRVLSTHFEKNKGQKDKLKGHQYSFLANQKGCKKGTSTHFWPQHGFDIEKFSAANYIQLFNIKMLRYKLKHRLKFKDSGRVFMTDLSWFLAPYFPIIAALGDLLLRWHK